MDIEQEAAGMGWVPQDKFRGDPEKWVDAETFVERGHTFMPILKANNRKLEEQLSRQSAEVNRLKNLFEASQEAIQQLQEVHTTHTREAVERAKREVLAQLKDAKESGDVELEVQLTDQLTDLKAAQKEAEKKPLERAPQTQQPSADAVHPDFAQWMSDNPWFGTDERKTQKAMGFAQILRADPENAGLVGRAFFDRVKEMVEGKQTESTPPQVSKVAGSRPSGSAASGGRTGKGYADLPAEAKAACDRQGSKLIGEGRAFKDAAAWQQYYSKLYFAEE